jgi:hypothetical protein
MLLTHRTRSCDVTISTAASLSTSIDVRDVAACTLHMSGVTATGTVNVYGSSDGVTFVAVYGSDGEAATVTVPAAGGSCVLPDAVYPLRYVRLVASSDLGTNATASVSLKS